MPALVVAPNPAPAGSVVSVTGSGFANARTRLTLDGAGATTNIFRPRKDGTFAVGITVAATVKSQALVAEQYTGGKWIVVARLAPLLTFLPYSGVDTTAPVVTGQQIINITSTSVTVSWTTNEPSTSQVDYGTTTGYALGPTTLVSALVTTHTVTVTGLTASTLYHFRIRSKDSALNEVVGVDMSGTTFAGGVTDTTPPVISNVTATVAANGTSAQIAWSLDEYATGQVQYGLTIAYGSFSLKESSFAYNSHNQQITSLTPNQTYHYRVISADASGNQSVSSDATFVTTVAVTGTFPPDTVLANTARPTIPALPTLGVAQAEPTWGTQIIRVSAVDQRRNEYAKVAAWNCDQSQLMLKFASPTAFLNGTTYAAIRTSAGIGGYATWSAIDPLKIYTTQDADTKLFSTNATTDAVSTVHEFSGLGYNQISLGKGEGGVSNDDKYIALQGRKAGPVYWIIVYNISTDTVLAQLNVGAVEPNNVKISGLGNYVGVQWDADGTGATNGFQRYNRDLTNRLQLATQGRHWDMGLNAAGQEIAVTLSPVSPDVRAYDLGTGAMTVLLSQPNTAFQYGHVSCRNVTRPGWVYLSVYDYPDTAGRLGRDQVIALKTDGSQTVEVFAFSNHNTDGIDYNTDPFACPSPDGQRVVFGSDWGAGAVGPTYAYVAGLTV